MKTRDKKAFTLSSVEKGLPTLNTILPPRAKISHENFRENEARKYSNRRPADHTDLDFCKDFSCRTDSETLPYGQQIVRRYFGKLSVYRELMLADMRRPRIGRRKVSARDVIRGRKIPFLPVLQNKRKVPRMVVAFSAENIENDSAKRFFPYRPRR